MIAITAIIRVKPGHAAAMRTALLEVAAGVATDEPGTVGYFIGRSAGQPELFTTYERFADRAALDRHMSAPAVVKLIALAKDILAEPMIVHEMTELSAHQR